MKKHIANIITGSRIVFSLPLLFLPLSSAWFYVFYLLCGVSDMIDGTVARKTNSASDFGARLDTVSDSVFMTVALIKFLPHFHIPVWLWIWISIIAMIKLGNAALGFVRTKKLISPHTLLNKITGLLLFLLPVTITFIELTYILPFACAVATAAAIHEVYFTYSEKNMILETKRLVIREYTPKDFDALYEILSDAETMKYYPNPYDENGVRRWIDWCIGSYKQNGFGLWALELKETGEFIGDCGISMQNIGGEILPEIGYHVNKTYWRQGYAKEACAAVKDWLFQNTDFDSVYSYMNQENVASCATAAANGMTKIKAYETKEEKLYVYRITRDEWEKSRNAQVHNRLEI